MEVRRPVIFGAILTCLAAPALAQDSTPLASRAIANAAPVVRADSPAEQLVALRQWTADYTEWKSWYLKWRSVPEPGLWSTRQRRPSPVPPPWLPDMCASRLVDDGPLADACAAFADWSAGDDEAQVIAQQRAQSQRTREAPKKTLWWERIHVDALWPMTQSGSSALGIAGMHTTMHVTNRFQVFLTPGVIMMRVPSLQGGMTWSPATDWGFSYRLFDFRMPALGRPSSVHFNIVRVWVLGQHAIQSTGEMYLAGFSVTFKKR
jgi:hypothetical protein